MATRTERNPTLDIVRCLASLGIMFSHTGNRFFSRSSGGWGVSVFLVLSGFTMVYSYYGKKRITRLSPLDNLSFSFHKIRRLYPLHVLMTLVSSRTILMEILDGEMVAGLATLVLNFLLMQEYVPLAVRSPDGVSWYLCVAVLFYALFPYLLRRMERTWTLAKATATITISVVAIIVLGLIGTILPNHLNDIYPIWTDNVAYWLLYNFPVTRLWDILIGCNLGYIYINTNHKRGDRTYTILEMLSLAVTALVLYICYRAETAHASNTILWWRYSLVELVSTCLLIYTFAIGGGMVSRLLTRQWILYMARISAYTFLIHPFVFACIRYGTLWIGQIVGYNEEILLNWMPLLRFALGIPATVLCSESWIRIDKFARHRFVTAQDH